MGREAGRAGGAKRSPQKGGKMCWPPHACCALLSVPPEQPQLSCSRKSPLSNVGCEWSPQRPPSPTTKAVLLVKKL